MQSILREKTRPDMERRQFLALLAAAGLSPLLAQRVQATSAKARIITVGGGFAGATSARLLKQLLPAARITLIEPNPAYVACPFSNLMLSGLRSLGQQTFSYRQLQQEGVEIIADMALQADPEKKRLRLKSGKDLAYDRLILAPGIDIRWNALEGYDEKAEQKMPHAWKAGAQTLLLRRQLEAMPAGGKVLLCITAAPFRCPPGPYERASLIARYLQAEKPGSKLIILDSNERFSKQALFMQAWKTLYPGIVEWHGSSDDGRVIRVYPDALVVRTDFESLRGQVVNVVPPQQAGRIAIQSGVADETGWCPVNPLTFESSLAPDIFITGDATIAAPMPKSAFAANMQAKVAALQLARQLAGLEAEATTLANTCFSFLNAEEAVSVSGVYRNDDGILTQVEGAGGTTPLDATQEVRQLEAGQAASWFRSLTHEAFGV